MNRDSVDVVVFSDYDKAVEHGPGAIIWEGDPLESGGGMIFIVPGETGPRYIDVSPIGGKKDGRPVWKISGTKEKPTLHPSINALDHDDLNKSVWHGWLKNGRFESC